MRQIRKEQLLEAAIILLAFIAPLIFFSSLEWNPEKATNEFMDKFFGADVWRVLENLKDTEEESHYRDNVHPYFSLIAVTIAKAGAFAFGVGLEFKTYKIFFGTLGTFLFWFYLYKQTDVFSAFAAMALLLSTMTVRVWSTLPETFIFGFFTLMVAMNAVRFGVNPIFVGIVSLAGTITNVFFGLLYAVKRYSFSKQLVIFVFLSAIVGLSLSLLQKNLYPTSVHFFDFLYLEEEVLYVNRAATDIPFRIFDFFFSGFLLPLQVDSTLPIMSKSVWSTFFYGETSGLRLKVAVYSSLTLITFLLMTGTYVLIKTHLRSTCGLLIFGFIVFQLILHCSYGDTPFLYSYHFTPFLILLITQYQTGILSKARPFLLVVLAVAIQEVNLSQFEVFKILFL